MPAFLYQLLKGLLKQFMLVIPEPEKKELFSDFFTPTDNELADAIRSLSWNLNSDLPTVSVIIPVFNQFNYTKRAVWSVIHQIEQPIELIIIDDQSNDATQAFFSDKVPIKYIRNEENLGFLKSCNLAASMASGEYLFFLNNDTFVQDNAIAELVSVFASNNNAGLVGSKLIYPNGHLQEAGGYVWSDASGWNFGRMQDPDHPSFNYARSADYISGAAIMIPKILWERIGGFDERYAPAYYEDTDLAFRIRLVGLDVIYQPSSVVTHFEGISSGTDLNTGIKAYQKSNQQKFLSKWQYQLEEHEENHQINELNPPHERKPRVLIIDTEVPSPDSDAGSVVAVGYNKVFQDLGFNITFLPENLYLRAAYGRKLQKQGIEVVHFPVVTDVEAYLSDNISRFDLVFLVRHFPAGSYTKYIKNLRPDLKIIFNTADLHHLREERESKIVSDLAQKEEIQVKAEKTKLHELEVIKTSDATIVVSEFEKRYLCQIGLNQGVHCIPLIIPTHNQKIYRTKRHGIAFIGGYRHVPNIDAVWYFVKEIWPLIKQKVPDIHFYIVGANVPSEFDTINDPNVTVIGYVEDLELFLKEMVLTVVPLQFGAGIKGKIGSSLACGVPVVSTEIGVEGMGLTDLENVSVGVNPELFAERTVQLYHDERLWRKLSENGKAFVEDRYSISRIKDLLSYLLLEINYVPQIPIDGFATIKMLVSDLFNKEICINEINTFQTLSNGKYVGYIDDIIRLKEFIDNTQIVYMFIITPQVIWQNEDCLNFELLEFLESKFPKVRRRNLNNETLNPDNLIFYEVSSEA